MLCYFPLPPLRDVLQNSTQTAVRRLHWCCHIDYFWNCNQATATIEARASSTGDPTLYSRQGSRSDPGDLPGERTSCRMWSNIALRVVDAWIEYSSHMRGRSSCNSLQSPRRMLTCSRVIRVDNITVTALFFFFSRLSNYFSISELCYVLASLSLL